MKKKTFRLPCLFCYICNKLILLKLLCVKYITFSYNDKVFEYLDILFFLVKKHNLEFSVL